jgi:hypothetical protein
VNTKEKPRLPEGRDTLIGLVKAREETLDPPDRYAALLSRCQTSARELTFALCNEITDWQLRTGKRRGRRYKTGVVFVDAIERFVGDLLRAKADKNCSGRIYHALGRDDFDDVPVSYDLFKNVLNGLKALELVGHEMGQQRYSKGPFGTAQLPGRASRFWATDKLVKLAEHYGVRLDAIKDHFKPDPPYNPLVLRDYAVGKGVNKERGRIIKDYQRTKHTERLAADIRDLNEFLVDCEITGGEHHGFTRNFNNAAWDKGGRLHSVGGGYQHLPEKKRVLMTINGEAVSEVDIKASFLTIYHARLGVRLAKGIDPYVTQAYTSGRLPRAGSFTASVRAGHKCDGRRRPSRTTRRRPGRTSGTWPTPRTSHGRCSRPFRPSRSLSAIPTSGLTCSTSRARRSSAQC